MNPKSWITTGLLLAGLALAVAYVSALHGQPDTPDPTAELSGDVRKFGAVGDGTTDDTLAIQRAIDSGVGDIVFPKGTYRISKTLHVDLRENGYTSVRGNSVATILMTGDGPALRITGSHYSSADPARFDDIVWRRERMPCIDGMAFTATSDAADAIEAAGTMQLTITRTHIRGCRNGVRLIENNRNVIISDCHIYENHGVGIYYDNVNLHQSNISGCHISYNSAGGIVSRDGNVRNIHISGCDLESNMGPALPGAANVLIDCSESQYGTGEVAITGCTIQHNHTAADTANIRILGGGLKSPTWGETQEGHVTISGNVLSDVDVNVHLKQCRGVTLTGNTLWMGYRENLLIEECNSVVIGANNLDRNPRYAYGDAATTHNAVVIRNSEDCNINGLHVTRVQGTEAAVRLQNCNRINLSDCTILDCDGVGLLLENLTNSRISGCLIRDDRREAGSTPMKVIGGSGNRIEEMATDFDSERR